MKKNPGSNPGVFCCRRNRRIGGMFKNAILPVHLADAKSETSQARRNFSTVHPIRKWHFRLNLRPSHYLWRICHSNDSYRFKIPEFHVNQAFLSSMKFYKRVRSPRIEKCGFERIRIQDEQTGYIFLVFTGSKNSAAEII